MPGIYLMGTIKPLQQFSNGYEWKIYEWKIFYLQHIQRNSGKELTWQCLSKDRCQV